MKLKDNEVSEFEMLAQHFVFVSRTVVDSYSTHNALSQHLISDLKRLIKKADAIGVHGAAFFAEDPEASY